MATGFIAETDERGRVVCVWRKGDRDRIARPVLEPESFRAELSAADCFGAAPEAISQWFARHGLER